MTEPEATAEKKKGRPPIAPHMRRVQVSTTITVAQAEVIDEQKWKINELIVDGMLYRTERPKLFENIGKLQAIILDKEAANGILEQK